VIALFGSARASAGQNPAYKRSSRAGVRSRQQIADSRSMPYAANGRAYYVGAVAGPIVFRTKADVPVELITHCGLLRSFYREAKASNE
jgi:hypothetical protein